MPLWKMHYPEIMASHCLIHGIHILRGFFILSCLHSLLLKYLDNSHLHPEEIRCLSEVGRVTERLGNKVQASRLLEGDFVLPCLASVFTEQMPEKLSLLKTGWAPQPTGSIAHIRKYASVWEKPLCSSRCLRGVGVNEDTQGHNKNATRNVMVGITL